MFKFQLEKSLDLIPTGSSLVCHIQEEPVIAYGKLQSLFGKPIYETENLEDQFTYCLSAQDGSGDVVVLYVYSAGSGPAIGGNHDSKTVAAAEQLVEMIRNVTPVDYTYTGYYLDGPAKLQMGIKDGVPYMEEEEMSAEEFAEVCKKLFSFNR